MSNNVVMFKYARDNNFQFADDLLKVHIDVGNAWNSTLNMIGMDFLNASKVFAPIKSGHLRESGSYSIQKPSGVRIVEMVVDTRWPDYERKNMYYENRSGGFESWANYAIFMENRYGYLSQTFHDINAEKLFSKFNRSFYRKNRMNNEIVKELGNAWLADIERMKEEAAIDDRAMRKMQAKLDREYRKEARPQKGKIKARQKAGVKRKENYYIRGRKVSKEFYELHKEYSGDSWDSWRYGGQ